MTGYQQAYKHTINVLSLFRRGSMERLMHYALVVCVVSVIIHPASTCAQNIESTSDMPTDVADYHLFTENPAIANPARFSIGFMDMQRARDVKTTVQNDDSSGKTKTKVAESDHALGLLIPVGGGAAIGLTGEILDQDHSSTIDTSSKKMKETFRKDHVNTRLIVKLVDKVRAGISLRYTGLENKIYGAYSLDDAASTTYKGSLTGFAAGLHYGDGPLLFGASYTGPMRGKINVHGEKLIATESGFINVNLAYGGNKNWGLAFAVKRWLHKSDGKSKDYQIPNSEDHVSLNGINVEQYLYPVTKYSVGADTGHFGDFFVRLSLSQTEYVFLFEDGSVPGDDPDQETPLKAFNSKISIAYNPSSIAIDIGLCYEQREKNTVDDIYKDYAAVDKTVFAAFTYKR